MPPFSWWFFTGTMIRVEAASGYVKACLQHCFPAIPCLCIHLLCTLLPHLLFYGFTWQCNLQLVASKDRLKPFILLHEFPDSMHPPPVLWVKVIKPESVVGFLPPVIHTGSMECFLHISTTLLFHLVSFMTASFSSAFHLRHYAIVPPEHISIHHLICIYHYQATLSQHLRRWTKRIHWCGYQWCILLILEIKQSWLR